MKKTAECIANYYIKKQIIDSDMKTIYVHGISLIMNDILNFSMILIISALVDSLLNGIIFTSVFYFLRVRCGGFHAKKEWICRITMLVTYMSVFVFSQIIKILSAQWIILPVIILSALVLLPIIPVENPNKRLTDAIRKKNKVLALITIFLCSLTAIVLTVIYIHGGVIITLTLLSVAVLAVMGKIVNKKREVSEIER